MAKFTCAYSGLVCEVSHLPISLNSREYAHPVFFFPQKKLLGLVSKFSSGELENIDSYLLYLALFNSTDLVEFRVPATYVSNKTPGIVACNLEALAEVAFKINAISVPSFQVPRFTITPETKTLDNSHFWIAAWEAAIHSFLEGNRRQLLSQDLKEIEERIYRHILDPNTKPQKYAVALSVWAAKAGNFPEFQTETPFGIMTLSEYWQLIIRKCINEKAMFDIPKADVNELITHIEDNIEMGSVYSHSLIKLLEDGRKKQIEYLGLGDLDAIDIGSPYLIVEDSTSTTDTNLISIIQVAPLTEPQRMDYPSEFEFQRARIRYLAAQRNQIVSSSRTE